MMDYRAGQVIEVTTRDVAHGGWCVAQPEDGLVVFVRHALPGETVLARLTEVTSRLARADAVEILKASPTGSRHRARTRIPAAAVAATGSTWPCPRSDR